MPREDWHNRILKDPDICFGRSCIRGTRIWASLIVDNLAEGVSEGEILEAYSQLTCEDIHVAQSYAEESERQGASHEAGE